MKKDREDEVKVKKGFCGEEEMRHQVVE